MTASRPLWLLVLFLGSYCLKAQVDPRKLDSLKAEISRQSRSIQQWQDSFKKKEDSIYREQVALRPQRPLKEPGRDVSSTVRARRDKRLWIYFLPVTILLVALTFRWRRGTRGKQA